MSTFRLSFLSEKMKRNDDTWDICRAPANSDFFHEQMIDHKIKLKFLSNMRQYFEGFEEELKNNKEGADLIMNHIDGMEKE